MQLLLLLKAAGWIGEKGQRERWFCNVQNIHIPRYVAEQCTPFEIMYIVLIKAPLG